LPAAAAHEHKAPRGGVLVEVGEEFAHVEFLHEPASGRLIAYVLDGEADLAVRLPQESFQIQLKSGEVILLSGVGSPLTGESPGDTSQFEGVAVALQGVSSFEGNIVALVVKGQRFENIPFVYDLLKKGS
jgi:hypothetical protein